MCLGGGGDKPKEFKPAAAPAPPLPAAEVPDIGEAREKENKKNFGRIDGPRYRFRSDNDK